MRSGSIAFLTGILALQGFKELPENFWLVLLCAILILSRFFVSSAKFNILKWMLLGFAWAWLHASWMLSSSLPVSVEGKNVEILGYIASIPVNRGRLTRFMFDVESAKFNGQPVSIPERLRLNWYGNAPELLAGDKWQLVVRLKRPHGFMNPGGFDYEKWLFSQRIGATGYVRTREGYHLLSSNWADYPVQRLRQDLLLQIQDWLAGHPVQGIVAALVLGSRDQISQQQWQVFRQTGTNHLVAISGLHIGLVAGLVFFMVRWLWSRLGYLPLLIAAPLAASFMSFICAALYAALAGWSLPTQRALIMIAVIMLAHLSKRHVQPSYGLSLALFLVLLHDPMAVMSPGFWLSFGAVGLIFLAMQGNRNGHAWWDKWFRVQWVVGLGLLPALILFFQQGSLIAPLANFIAVPVVSLLVVPALLSGMLLGGLFPVAGKSLLGLGAWVLAQLTELLSDMGGFQLATWSGASPDIIPLLASILGILLLLFAPLRSNRWLGLVLLLPVVFYQGKTPDQGEVYFTLLDVGQGLSAVIQTQNHSLVFDTGARFSDSFDTGSAVVMPFLRQEQIRKLDTLIISHGDNDHIGGADSLLGSIRVNKVYSSAQTLLNRQIASRCDRGIRWQWDGVEFHILHPDFSSLSQRENNQSCVLHVKSRYGSILLPGDIEREAEYQLVEEWGDSLRADVLVAPHHGSKTSSTKPFIQAVQPAYVLFPVGYRNRYRFPFQKVVSRYTEQGVMGLLDTARNGAIQFKLVQDPLQRGPKRMRQTMQSYWHHPVTD